MNTAYFFGKSALKRIQSAEDNEMYCNVTQAALHMATAGCLDEANELLEYLWQYKWPHSPDAWLSDQSFQVLWHAAGKRPSFVPFPQKSIDSIELAHRQYMSRDGYALPMPSENPDRLEGLNLFRRSCSFVCPSPDSTSLPAANHELEGLKGLEKWLQKPEPQDGYLYDRAACLAAELAAKNGLAEKAIQIARSWATRYSETNGAGFNFPCMASNRHAAKLLLQGILSEALGLTPAACQVNLKDLKQALNSRMKLGRKLAYGKWTWEKLLDTAGKRAMKVQPEFFTKEQRKSKSLKHPPASPEAKQAAEERLKLKLPADYMEFLGVSNGFAAISSTTPALLGIEKINFLKNAVGPEVFDTLKDYPGEKMARTIDSSILISEVVETDMVLLIPPAAGDNQWQTWFFADWIPGEICFPTFRHYFEDVFQKLQSDTVV